MSPRSPVASSRPRLAAPALLLVAPWVAAQAKWTEIKPPTTPPMRAAHMMSADLLTAFVFGGNSSSTTFYNDLWSFNGTVWTLRTADQAPGSPPPRRWGSMAYDFSRGALVLFGGMDPSGNLLGDTWVFNGATWAQKTGAAPSARRWAGLAYDYANSRVLLFGGRDAVGSLADTWTFDGSQWQKLSPNTSPPARGRQGMASKEATKEIVLFGGTSGTASPALADMWVWDGKDWAGVTTNNAPYGGTLTHGMTWDTVRERLVVFGGYNGGEKGGTWEFDGKTWVDRNPATAPATRSRPGMAWVPLLRKSIVFGGYGGAAGFLGDTWEYQTDAEARFSTSGRGCAGSGGTPTLTANTLPWIGDTFELALGSIGAGNALLVIGLSNTTWSGGALPFNLGPIGYPACDLQVSMNLLVGGLTVVPMPIPNTASLAGVTIYFQAASLGPGNQLGVSGAGAAKLGLR